jgi:hypothetical protein
MPAAQGRAAVLTLLEVTATPETQQPQLKPSQHNTIRPFIAPDVTMHVTHHQTAKARRNPQQQNPGRRRSSLGTVMEGNDTSRRKQRVRSWIMRCSDG